MKVRNPELLCPSYLTYCVIVTDTCYFSDLLDEIDKLCAEYISKVRELAPTDRKDYFTKIENAFQKSREYRDDKVQLAVQTYEMVSAS